MQPDNKSAAVLIPPAFGLAGVGNHTWCFEILRMLLDALLKVSPSLPARKQKLELTAVGVELFLLYSALVDVSLIGQKILKELNNAVQWMARKIEAGEQDRAYGTHINELIMLQRYNLQLDGFRKINDTHFVSNHRLQQDLGRPWKSIICFTTCIRDSGDADQVRAICLCAQSSTERKSQLQDPKEMMIDHEVGYSEQAIYIVTNR